MIQENEAEHLQDITTAKELLDWLGHIHRHEGYQVVKVPIKDLAYYYWLIVEHDNMFKVEGRTQHMFSVHHSFGCTLFIEERYRYNYNKPTKAICAVFEDDEDDEDDDLPF